MQHRLNIEYGDEVLFRLSGNPKTLKEVQLMNGTTVKEEVLKMAQDLPPDVSIEEVMERLYLLYKVEKGLAQADQGEKVTQEEARRRMRQWLR